jgi:hypothetical protein
MTQTTTETRVWGAGTPKKLGIGQNGKSGYRVGHTLFVNGMPAERTNICFYASKPKKALAEIFASGRSPADFHGHEFE